MNICSKGKMGLIVFALFFALFYLLSSAADARVGGGRSFGSRGGDRIAVPQAPRHVPTIPRHGLRLPLRHSRLPVVL